MRLDAAGARYELSLAVRFAIMPARQYLVIDVMPRRAAGRASEAPEEAVVATLRLETNSTAYENGNQTL